LLKEMRQGAEHLVFIGPEWSRGYSRRVRREIERLGLQSSVHLLGAFAPERLKAAYQEARIGVFMSECESCPNILLEAMAAGSPMVVSARMPMPEFAGDAVLYADPARPLEVADQMARLLADSNLRHILGELGKQRIERFDAEAEAKKSWGSIAAAFEARSSQGGHVHG
jgi:glycosyltransferase involved in cell wall biosynthesis